MGRFELLQNESLFRKGKLQYIAGRLNVTSRDVYLTSSRFVVCKQNILVASGAIGVLFAPLVKSHRIEIEIPLKDIVSVGQEKYGLRGKKTVIKIARDKEVSFLGEEGTWVEAIEEAVQNCRPDIRLKTNGESIALS